MVPDNGAWAEPQRPAAIPQPPAQVDVVARRPELRVESTNFLQRAPSERRVAAGKVLGLAIGDEDVHGAARRLTDATGYRPVAGMLDVGPSDPGVRGGEEARSEKREPVWVRSGIVVEVGHD